MKTYFIKIDFKTTRFYPNESCDFSILAKNKTFALKLCKDYIKKFSDFVRIKKIECEELKDNKLFKVEIRTECDGYNGHDHYDTYHDNVVAKNGNDAIKKSKKDHKGEWINSSYYKEIIPSLLPIPIPF